MPSATQLSSGTFSQITPAATMAMTMHGRSSCSLETWPTSAPNRTRPTVMQAQ